MKPKCPKCGGAMFMQHYEYDISLPDEVCINCGYRHPPERVFRELARDGKGHLGLKETNGYEPGFTD